MLVFDRTLRELLDVTYVGADVTRRRGAALAALAPEPGERILDLGCGQGFLTLEVARAIGPTGEVIGLDPSAEMLGAAEPRCADTPWIRLQQGRAGAVPVADGGLDAAVSLQVFEYVPDVPAALADLFRALRPGGRLVIGDMQFATMSLMSEDSERLERMCRAYDRHVVEPNLPGCLPAMLRDAGFHGVGLRPLPFVSTALRPDSLANMTIHLMAAFAAQNGHVPQDEADAFLAEQKALAQAGRFFFSLTHFIATAIRP